MAIGTGAAILGSAGIGALGSLFGGKKQSGGSTTQTVVSEPASYLKPYLQQGLGEASSQYFQGGPEVYQGDTYAGMSPQTVQALQAQMQRSQGSPLVGNANQFVQQGLNAPISSQFGQSQNPYSTPIGAMGGTNPYAGPVDAGGTTNPFSQAVTQGTISANPYAGGENPFGGASNPYLDQTFNKALDSAVQGVKSRFAGVGRNTIAGLPVAGDIASSLAAQIYAPAYENERNRQLSYGQQQLGIGANAFEAQQGRQLQSGLAAQQIGAGSYDAGQARQLTSNLAGQQIGAGSYENLADRQLQSGLAGQQIGAQGYENAQGRQLSDLTNQRSLQQNLLGYVSPLAAQDYLDIAQARDAGAAYDTHLQNTRNDEVNRFNLNQQQPYQNLDQYLQRIALMNGGGGSSTSTGTLPPQYSNPLSGALGGALLGTQFGGLFGSNTPDLGQIGNYSQIGADELYGRYVPPGGLFSG